ncbi:hypothetical protein RB595_009445 [Gaeumannomyces hyphopodioides]
MPCLVGKAKPHNNTTTSGHDGSSISRPDGHPSSVCVAIEEARKEEEAAQDVQSMEERRANNFLAMRCYELTVGLLPPPFSRYVRAFEVGKPADSVAYDLAVKVTSLKRTAIIRNRIRLPHNLATNIKIAVICKPGSRAAAEARMAGAVAVGEETIFEAVRDGSMEFNKLVCHVDSLPALTAANLGRILGPKGMMPSAKTGTIAKDVKSMMREMIGASDYKEKEGVVRMAIGKLSFTPEMLAENIKAFIAQLKKDMSALEEQTDKGIDEIVLSATHSPGFSLSGGFNPSDPAVTTAALSTPM